MSVVGCSLITFMGKLFLRKGHVLDPNYFNQVFMQPIFVRPCQDLDLRPYKRGASNLPLFYIGS